MQNLPHVLTILAGHLLVLEQVEDLPKHRLAGEQVCHVAGKKAGRGKERVALALAEVLPSAGKAYAGDYVPPGLVARAAGGGLLVLGLADPWGPASGSEQLFSRPARAAVVVGVLATIGGTVYDVATSASSAREYNADSHHVQIVPTFDPGTSQVGMAVGGVL